MRFDLARNPNRFVWDFWYWFDPEGLVFHVLYLNADYKLVPDGRHHLSARIGYATTPDFQEVTWIDDQVFCADQSSWDNTSIWSGDLVRTESGFVMFYTSRDRRVNDGFTQHVGMARSTDLRSWTRLEQPLLIADERWYEGRSIEGDTTIHAWRDPFLFRKNGRIHMLLSAKYNALPLGRKGAVALLDADDGSLENWTVRPPLFAPGWYSECEVPQTYVNEHGDDVMVFSTWARFDHAPTSEGRGGLHAIGPNTRGPTVLLPEREGLYACRIIPELRGDIVGFDFKQGGWRRVALRTRLRSVHV